MRLISNQEVMVVAGGYGVPGGSANPEEITITTAKGCDKYYPLPGGKEWNTVCKTEVGLAINGVGEFPKYNPDWKKVK